MIDLSSALKNSAPLQVHAHWDPIADATYNLHKNSPENVELFDLSPNEPTREYNGEAFNAFLPSSSVTVGDVWKLDLDSVIPFLSQFHPGATGEYQHLSGTGFCHASKNTYETSISKIQHYTVLK